MPNEYDDLESRISAVIATQLAAQQEVHDRQIADLRKALEDERRAREVAVSALPASERVPLHGAGPGTEVSETWSQAEQAHHSRDKSDAERALDKLSARVAAVEELSEVRGQAHQALSARVAALESARAAAPPSPWPSA